MHTNILLIRNEDDVIDNVIVLEDTEVDGYVPPSGFRSRVLDDGEHFGIGGTLDLSDNYTPPA